VFDYLPINTSILRTDTIIGCDLYLFVKTTADSRYILYCKGDAVFENQKKEKLVEKNISRLFIKKDNQQKYFDYLESNFQDIISDIKIPPDDRIQIVHSAATNLVKDLFKDPKSENIERTKKFAYTMVDYILNEDRIAHGLLKIAIHEYYTYTHSVNVAAVGTLFVKNLGLKPNDLKHFCAGILLHDLGKTKISTDILNKKGKLTKEEFAKIKEHPELGVAILKEKGSDFKDEYIITLQHHENYDGTGYPYGLKKEEIHTCGKIARIIDVYDALTTNRPYARAIRPFAALTEMKETMLNCFDKELFKEFIRFLGPYDPREKTPRKDDRLYS
jgi:HD-GYP domain-containing protein (c-di-GMP phosphodiesterase class II)